MLFKPFFALQHNYVALMWPVYKPEGPFACTQRSVSKAFCGQLVEKKSWLRSWRGNWQVGTSPARRQLNINWDRQLGKPFDNTGANYARSLSPNGAAVG